MYRDIDAYKVHLETAHFKKYKAVTEAMVRYLNLVPVNPIILGAKGS
jgi:quinol monooxygenase YgiN